MRKTLLESFTSDPLTERAPEPDEASLAELARAVNRAARARLGHSLSIRQVDAGSCNGCELEAHALANPYYNIEGLGIKYVASPRHADALMVTGPVSKHMAIALVRTYDAMPEPKLVIAVGQCACDGGIFGESYATIGPLARILPVDVAIPGCPPSPTALLQGILAAIRAWAPPIAPAEPTLARTAALAGSATHSSMPERSDR